MVSAAHSAPISAQTLASTLKLLTSEARASAVVLDWTTGAVLAAEGPTHRGAPGSTIKPLLLQYALDHGIVKPQTQVYCRRDLRIGGRRLPCTHPVDNPVFTAESALSESCNTWFANLGTLYTGEQLETALNATGLSHGSMISANVEQRQLAALGLSGVVASPLELARAYRDLLLRASPSGPVVLGLAGSVSYGMANQAAVKGLTILGKTGTASDPARAWTHGWFAGAIPDRVVLVIYVPHADGGTAAFLARSIFQRIPPQPSAQRPAR